MIVTVTLNPALDHFIFLEGFERGVIQRFSKGFQIEILNQETVAVVKNIRVDDLDFTYGCVRNIHD